MQIIEIGDTAAILIPSWVFFIIQTGATVLALVIGFYIKHRFGSYLTKKGENRATKEDVGEITALRQEVVHRFDMMRLNIEQIHQLQLAIIDRRLQIHQEAYIWASRILKNAHNPNEGEAASFELELREWIMGNNLYLEESVRAALDSAWRGYFAYRNYSRQIAENRSLAPNQFDEIQRKIEKAYDAMMALAPIIEKAVNLPPINFVMTNPPGVSASSPEPGVS